MALLWLWASHGGGSRSIAGVAGPVRGGAGHSISSVDWGRPKVLVPRCRLVSIILLITGRWILGSDVSVMSSGILDMTLTVGVC